MHLLLNGTAFRNKTKLFYKKIFKKNKSNNFLLSLSQLPRLY